MYILKQEPEDFLVDELIQPPSGSGTYHYYLLKKRLLGTGECAREIAQALHIPRRNIGYCGNKDRRAVTTQYISIKNKKIESFTRGNWSIEYISSGPRPLSLGLNEGNRFTLTIRNVDHGPKFEPTFINYFGEQRFGTTNVQVGLLLLQQKFADAAKLLADDGHTSVQSSLEEHPQDPVRAIRTVSLRLLKLLIHSLQSEIWNRSVYELGTGAPEELPIVGFATELSNDPIGQTISRILQEYKITARDFIIRSIPQISSEGSMRNTKATAKKIKSSYDVDERTVAVSFELSKGTYATEFIRQNLLCTREPPTSKQT